MSLKEKILADLKTSMLAKDSARTGVVRFLQSAVKNREIELRPQEITDDEILSVIKKLVKQRKESIEQFQQAGRKDLVDQESGELTILEAYLPAQMGREEIEKIVLAAIAKTGAKGPKDMGLVMKEVQAVAAGKADNKIVSEVVKTRLV